MTEHSLTRAELLRRGVGFAAFVSAGPGVLEAILANPASAAVLTTRAGGGTLLAAIAGDPKTMDPHRTTLAVFHNTIRVAVFDALVKIDDKLQIVPVSRRVLEDHTEDGDLLAPARASPSTTARPSTQRRSPSTSTGSRQRRPRATTRRTSRRSSRSR